MTSERLSASPLDLGAEAPQLVFQSLVPAIQILQIHHLGLAAGREAGDDHGGPRADVHGLHGRAGEMGYAGDDCRIAIDPNLGAQAPQFVHIAEPFLEDRLPDDAAARDRGQHRRDLRVQVGREPRVRRRIDIDGVERGIRLHPHTRRSGLDRDTGVAELGEQRRHVLGDEILH